MAGDGFNFNRRRSNVTFYDSDNASDEELYASNYLLPIRLTRLLRAPVKCPIAKCHKHIGFSMTLTHYLIDHNNDTMFNCIMSYAKELNVSSFNLDSLCFGESTCISMICYGGLRYENESRPATKSICVSNTFLPFTYDCLSTYLPIYLMAYKTTPDHFFRLKPCIIPKKEDGDKATVDIEPMIIMWAACVSTTVPIKWTPRIFNESRFVSHYWSLRVRNLKKDNDPLFFGISSSRYLILTPGELSELCYDGDPIINFEFTVEEDV